MPRKRSRPTALLFHNHDPKQIAAWCQVSLQTAYLYKIGQRKPSRQAVRLFVLHRDRRVLTDEWEGWLLKPEGIVDPEGNETYRSLLRGYFLMMQLVREMSLVRGGRAGRARYERIAEKMDDEHRRERGMKSLRDGASRR